MMGIASVKLLCRALGGLMLIGIAQPTAVHAVEQGWATVIEPKSEAIRRQMRAMPTAPPPARAKSAAKPAVRPVPTPKAQPKAAPTAAAKVDVPALVPVDEAEITTGAINAPKSDGALAPADAARLFSEHGDPPAGELTTGAVDGQASDLARGYCVSISGAAADTRTAMQMSKLAEMEKQIGQRIAVLEAKSAEYKSWVERRDQFLKRAAASLVKIYSQMEPDSAALQLVSMDEETAASLLLKLDPQNASAILNEMVPEKAARLAATISGAARLPRPNPPPPAARPSQPPPDLPARVYPNEGRS